MDYNGVSQKKGQQSVDPFCLLQTTVLTFSVGYSKNRNKGSMEALQMHSENVIPIINQTKREKKRNKNRKDETNNEHNRKRQQIQISFCVSQTILL